MLNKIILNKLSRQLPQSKAMLADPFEEPSTYHGWIFPMRFLLALRYQKYKQQTLAEFRSDKIYPVFDDDFHTLLLQKLSGKEDYNPLTNTTKPPIFSIGLKSLLVYPALIAALLFGLYSLNDAYQQRRVNNVLANHLPYYSDLLFRKLQLTHSNGSMAAIHSLNEAIDNEREVILGAIPKRAGIRKLMKQQLENLNNANISSQSIMIGFKDINTLFDDKDLPFYLTPKSFTLPCSSFIEMPVEQLMMQKKIESAVSNISQLLCRATMMTAYKVNQRNQLYYDDTANQQKIELPLFRVQRIDKVPAVDSALGLTFKDRGIGSIILSDRIDNFSKESVMPALTFQGRNYVIPYWMQGYYEIEEAVTKGYKKDLNTIYPKKSERQQVKAIVKQLIKDKTHMQTSKLQQTLERTNTSNDKAIFGGGIDAISVLLGKEKNKDRKEADKQTALKKSERKLLKKLNDVLYPSIEYHEAYHQIDKTSWPQTTWVSNTFKDKKLDDNGRDHMLEELGAYLAQLANTEEGHNIWLSKLLIFSVSPFTQNQAEFYASTIILSSMDALASNEKYQPHYKIDLDEKTRIYKRLSNMNNQEIRDLSQRAFTDLFGRPPPILN